MTTQQYLYKLVNRVHLSQKEAEDLLYQLTDSATPIQIAGVLAALTTKEESVEEVAGFILGMRKKMTTIRVLKNTIDVCGTGGDGKHTFNISTASAFVLAGGGIPVAKHGNRAASSQCGSADVLEALGINIFLTPNQTEEVLQKTGMVFLFAPLFHGAFKQVGMVRKELGIRTIFNYIGPFVNPAGVKRQVIGVPTRKIAKLLANVAASLSYKHVCIVTSEDGMDEVSLFAPTFVYEIKEKNIREFVINPAAYGFTKARMKDIFGGDTETNAAIIENVLAGKKGPARDITVLNSALGFVVAGKAKNLQQGIRYAKEAINGGAALRTLHNLRKETKQYA